MCYYYESIGIELQGLITGTKLLLVHLRTPSLKDGLAELFAIEVKCVKSVFIPCLFWIASMVSKKKKNTRVITWHAC